MQSKTIFFLTILLVCAILFYVSGLFAGFVLKLNQKANDLTQQYKQQQSEMESQLSDDEWELIWNECDKKLYESRGN